MSSPPHTPARPGPGSGSGLGPEPQAAVRRRVGWTLFELMVVLVVLSILTLTVLPRFAGSLAHARLHGTARELVGLLSLGSSEAITRRVEHRARYLPAQGLVVLERLEGQGTQRAFVPCRDLPRYETVLEADLALAIRPVSRPAAGEEPPLPGPPPSGPGTVGFRPDGTADGSELRLADEAGASVTLRVHPTTGRVAILAPPLDGGAR